MRRVYSRVPHMVCAALVRAIAGPCHTGPRGIVTPVTATTRRPYDMTPQPARSAERRKQDTLRRLEHDEDAWVATADADGRAPYLVPLSFLWDGAALLIATPAASPTGRNLATTGTTRLGIGPTRDVV